MVALVLGMRRQVYQVEEEEETKQGLCLGLGGFNSGSAKFWQWTYKEIA
jgi:hypothetical protein